MENGKVIDFTRELSADDIIAADDVTVFKTVVPEWKGTVYFKAMSAKRTLEFKGLMAKPAERDGLFVRMFQECACNSSGEQLFTTGQLEALRAKSAPVFLRLQNALMALNGIIQPEKTWATVQGILEEAGVPSATIALARSKWETTDTVELVKND